MIARTFAATAALGLLFTLPASAQLSSGAKAPQFAARGALNGKPFSFSLSKALKKGPVVLYFFPKAETPGCNAEAAAFAENIGEFQKAGAQVYGFSADNLDDLKKFSVKHCAGKFAVATATPAVIKAYDVSMEFNGQLMSNRTSYVIGKDGKIKFAHSDNDWREHVSKTLAKVKEMKTAS